jgi:hypothetical protein
MPETGGTIPPPMSASRIAVTSIVRHAEPGERSGFLRVLDLDAKRVLSTTAVPESAFRAIDPNPRGGYRGAKGLGTHGGRLVVANSERLFVLDRSWDVQADLTHPLLGSVHDLRAEADGILVTCTNCDALLRVGWDGQDVTWWTWRRDPALARALGYHGPPRFDPSVDYRDPRSTRGHVLSLVQLNGVDRDGDSLLLSFGRVVPHRVYARKRTGALAERLGLRLPRTHGTGRVSKLPAAPEPGSAFALVRVSGEDLASAHGEVVYRLMDVEVPNHNVLVAEGHVLYSDSNGGRLVELDLGAGREVHSVGVPGEPSFARGLAAWRHGLYLVGSQRPAAVHVADLAAGRIGDSVALSDDPRESVYAIALVPDDFDDPPGEVAFPD